MQRRGAWILALLWWCTTSVDAAVAHTEADGNAFFERRIRPLLIDKCYECHSSGKKVKGGLLLDSRSGWQAGGDTGAAIIPGDSDASLLIKAVRYDDPDFQMPPKNKLAADEIADLVKWVAMGAPDPRTAETNVVKHSIDIEKGRQFWAYQLPRKVEPPEVKDSSWAQSPLDRFILVKLEGAKMRPAPDADRATLARRIYFDLIGIPPTPAQIDEFVRDSDPSAYRNLVDRLLAHQGFGERWGRHWLDVARFGESVTLRGLVFKEAWRYRDYVIDAFNRDLPFDQFIREQIAGDLLPTDSMEDQRRQVIATTFLAIGNTNLEEQDKKQLRMDVVDEQLDTIGKAFLGQTIGCARCHDHKFDPIPTADYYAMAGILRNTKTLVDANVSEWIELPLPLEPEQEKVYATHEAELAALQTALKEAKELAAKLNPKKEAGVIAARELPGVVVDDLQARRVGEWKESQHSGRYVASGYLHDINEGKGSKTLTFLPELPHAGKYEVRLAYSADGNRAKNAPVTVFSADGEKTIEVDQRQPAPIDGRFISLGQYTFELNGQGFVIVGNEGTTGHVIADAVQFLAVDQAPKLASAPSSPSTQDSPEGRQADARVKELEAELKRTKERGPVRPKVMSVKEEAEIGDTYVHIRGSVHNRGAEAPRGFLKVASYGEMPSIPKAQSGRHELADWIASEDNPLTARVTANRVWHWLFGNGLVRTTDNFGTTGELPSHPELLDYLAVRLVEQGWSVKKLIREVVLSRTYQLSSMHDAELEDADPENRLLARMNRRRLDAECIRDAMLLVSGELATDRGGATYKPGLAADYSYPHTGKRRSVYEPVFRNALPEILETFDVADPSAVTGRRNTSIVAPQALFLMNHPFVIEQAHAAAKRLLAADATNDAERLERAYLATLGRAPSGAEQRIALQFIGAAGENEVERMNAWSQLYQTLFASIDFRFVE